MQDILDFVTKLTGDLEDPWPVIRNYFNSNGADCLVCGLVEVSSGNLVGIFTDLPTFWMQQYESEGYIEIDPWAKKAVSETLPFLYTFDQRHQLFPEKSSKVEAMLCDHSETGLDCSLLLPRLVSSNYVVGFNLWSSLPEKEFIKEFRHSVDHLSLAGAIAGSVIKEKLTFGNNPKLDKYYLRNPRFTNPLTAREIEALSWLSSGLRNDKIADKMGITSPTVNFHLSTVKRKLGAETREQALAIAIVNNFIQP